MAETPNEDENEEGYEDLIWREQAVDRLLALRESFLGTRAVESVSLDSIDGRVLAEPIVAETDAPTRSQATMDGFAFDADTSYPLDIRDGEAFPEDEQPRLADGEAVRVATGAPIPKSATAVVKREDAEVRDGELVGPPVETGTYVYERGSNWRAGERLFDAGERLSPRDAVLLADLGRESVPVRTRLSVGLVVTGSEFHEDAARDFDSEMLVGLIRSWGHDATIVGTVPDQYERVRDIVAETAGKHDVVVTTGGTSVGHKDYAIRALRDLGDLLFHRVRIRPGKPLGVGRLPDYDAVAVAVPGKPLGAHTVATLVARPLFTGQRAGMTATDVTVSAAVDCDVGLGPGGFEYAIPVTLSEPKRRTATPLGHVNSALSVYGDVFDPSVLSSLTRATRADGIVVTTETLSAGETVQVVPYDVLE